MPTTIKLKNSTTTTAAPSSLVQGEAAVNITDRKLWVGDASSTPVQIVGAGAPVSGTTATITSNATIGGTLGVTGVTTLTANPVLSGGTANGVAYLNGSKVLTTGSALTFDGTTLVNANGSVEVPSTATFKFGSGFTNYIQGNTSSNFLAFATNSAERMRLDASGNLGIGTSSPSNILQITKSSASNTFLQANNSVATSYYGVDAAGLAYVWNGSNYPVIFGTNNAERMRIDSSGNLLLATSTATNNLRLGQKFAIVADGTTTYGGMAITNYGNANADVQGIFDFNRSRGTTNGSMTIVANGDSLGVMVWRGSDGTSFRDAANIKAEVDGTPGSSDMPGRLVFSTTADGASSATERMRIDSSGRLLLNQTSNNGTALMQMISPASTNAILVQIGTNGNNAMSFLNSGGAANVGSITVNSGSTAYNTSSDYRLKENIAPMTGALAKVAQLKPCTYTWKADGSEGQGFIAHELAEIVPDAVTGEKDAVEIVEIKDEEGNVIGTEEKPIYQGIDTSFLVATLTAAIQELNAKVDALQTELNTLKGQ